MTAPLTTSRGIRSNERQPTALYRFYDRQHRLLYVGVTMDPAVRWKEHSKGRSWWREVRHATIDHYNSRDVALEAERKAVITEQPRWNVQFQVRRSSRYAGLDLDALGKEHRRLRKALAKVQDELADVMRAEYARGATLHDLLRLSGFSSMSSVRRIVLGATGQETEG